MKVYDVNKMSSDIFIDNFKNIFYHILCNYCDHKYNVNIESSYYTIILALIIYLKYNYQ